MGKRDRNLYYGKKLLLFLGSVFLLSVVVFYVARLAPGDPLVSYYGDRTEKMSPAEREWAMEKLGLNEPIYVQYVKWLENAVHGNFGISFKYKQDVIKVISQRMTNTLLLGGIGFLIIFAGSLLLGIFCAWNEEKWIDKILCRLGTISSCIPEFWISLVLILIFSVTLRILPSSGAYSTGKAADIPDRILHLILPLTVVSLEHLWYYAYMVRNKIQEEVRPIMSCWQNQRDWAKKAFCLAIACEMLCLPILALWQLQFPMFWAEPLLSRAYFPIRESVPYPTKVPDITTIIFL